MLDRAAQMLGGQYRGRLMLQRGEIVEVIVDRLHGADRGVLEEPLHPPLDLAGKQADAHVESNFQISLQLREHGKAAGYMKAANNHRNAGSPKRPCDIERARKLV